MGSTPSRLTGDMCARITVSEIKSRCASATATSPSRSARRDDGSITNAVLSGASNDLGGALASIDAYTGKPPTVTGVNVLLKMRRGADQAYIRGVSMPPRVRPGQRVRARVAAPARARRAPHPQLQRAHPRRDCARQGAPALVGKDADQGESAFTTILFTDEEEENEGGDPGPGHARELAAQRPRDRALGRRELRVGRCRTKRSATTISASPARPRRPSASCAAAERPVRGREAVDDARRRRRVDLRQRRASTAANASVEAAIISIRVSTGVASSFTPLA